MFSIGIFAGRSAVGRCEHYQFAGSGMSAVSEARGRDRHGEPSETSGTVDAAKTWLRSTTAAHRENGHAEYRTNARPRQSTEAFGKGLSHFFMG